jgi:2,4-dienoyl-CoA reductase-like NADH-dependent reductase (Old Yellow Enzyme family)
MTSQLFSPFDCRGVRIKNRIGVAPMCQYSSVDGLPNMWHQVHLGTRAVGGAGLVMTEASAVAPHARITPSDMGMWCAAHADAHRPIVAFTRAQGAVAGIQLAHAGRKGSTQVPWVGRRGIDVADGGWQPLAPSALPFNADYPLPAEMQQGDITSVTVQFADAARFAIDAGYEVIELHAGHGYLLHEFLSPLSNARTDRYGGSFDNRVRLVMDVVAALRRVMPDSMPLFVRFSATDWIEGGWDLEQSVALARLLKPAGVDLIDCSSGNITPASRGSMAPGFQMPLAEAIRKQAGIATAAVGGITEPLQAEQALQRGVCDIVLLARELLREPYWPLKASMALEGKAAPWPVQYLRAVSP